MSIRALAAALAIALLAGAAVAQPARAPDADGPEASYVVKPGDTLGGIAKAMLAEGVGWQDLARHNRLADPDRLAPGETLRIPFAWLRREPASARVIAVAGEVTAGGRALATGDQVAEGEVVRTGPNGYATFEFADRSIVRIRPRSELRIEAHQRAMTLEEFETRLRLGAGAIEAAVSRQRAPNFRIGTPSGNLAVRGTELRARAAAAVSQVEVVEGRVGVAGTVGAEVGVDGGFGTVVRAGEAPAPPVRLLPAPDLSRVASLQEQTVVRLAFPALERAERYRALVATDPELRQVVVEAAVRLPDVRIVDLRDGVYYYSVRAVDALGLEGLEARERFRLKARPLPPPPRAPLGEAPLAPGTVEFTWEAAPEAASYRFQLAADPGFSAPVILEREGLAERRLAAELAPGRYYWRVASTRADGDRGPFGDALEFEVRVPAPPAEPAPQPGAKPAPPAK